MDPNVVQPTPNPAPDSTPDGAPTPPASPSSELFAPDRPLIPITPKKSKKKPIIFTIVAIILILAAGYGAYYWEHARAVKVENSQQAQITALQKQVSGLQQKVSNQNKSSSSSTGSGSSTNQNVIKIPQLGIQITVPDSISDLVYSISSTASSTTANLSTTTLTKMDSQCSDTGIAPPLGALSKVSGEYQQTSPPTPPSLVKQFSGFYIGFTQPNATCTNGGVDSSTGKLAQTQLQALKDSLSTVQAIQ